MEPKSRISPDLLAHMRYPEDMFKVQRNMLATYHVTNPKTFYEGTDQWKVPEDPENKANKQPPVPALGARPRPVAPTRCSP